MSQPRLQAARNALNQQNWAKARSLFAGLLRDSPGDPAAVGGMGFACMQMARRSSGVNLSADQARTAAEKAAFFLKQAALTDGSPRTHRLLGEAYQIAGDYELAETSFRDSLTLSENAPDTWNLLGRTLVDLGRKEEAVEAFRRALKINPSFPDAWHQLRRLEKASEPADELNAVLAAIEAPTDFPVGRSALHMVAGRLCEQLDRFGDAYGHFRRAAELKPESTPFVPPLSERIEAIRANLNRSFFEARANWGDHTARPIFVIGLPRSGTTLTEQILDAHPEVHGVGELTDIASCKHELVRRSSGWLPGSHPLLQATPGHVRHLAVKHAETLRRLSGGATYVVDKMPGNFAHLGVIRLMYPNARIIHCTRDVRDVWISCLRNNLDRPYTTIDEMSEYQANYCALMDYWSNLWGDRIFHLNYESFVKDPEPKIRAMIDYCGLAWDDRCLRYFESDRAVRTPSKLAVRQPVYATSIGTWERYRPAIDNDIERFERISLGDPLGTAWQPTT